MRFESVTAGAFGPFCQRTLELAPRFNVVYGANESGKSSWHAALYAGLCGIRRAKGAEKQDQKFAERHQPWDEPDRWEVSVVIRLDEGRQVELSHELIQRMKCEARDRVLGRDYTQEIIFEGAPDGSRWLGLNRRSFQAVACVKQADILGILDSPATLQEDLQRAAATARTDSTAAAAINRIEDFRSEHIGVDRKGSTKPLRRALERSQRAREALQAAQDAHVNYLLLAEESQTLQEQARNAARRLRVVEARLAHHRAAAARTNRLRAQELADRYPNGPPSPLASDHQLAQQVSTAVSMWEARPPIPSLEGRPSAEIRGILDSLPDPPRGDLEVAAEIEAAWTQYDRAREAIRSHQSARPAQPTVPAAASGASEQELRGLAAILDEPPPQIDADLSTQLSRLQAKLAALERRRARRLPLITGAVAFALAVGLLVASAFMAEPLHVITGSIVLAIVGVGSLILWATGRNSTAILATHEALRELDSKSGHQSFRLTEWEHRQAKARSRAVALGLEPHAERLGSLAAEVADATEAQRQFEQWNARTQSLQTPSGAAREQLAGLLRTRGIPDADDLDAAFNQYRADCRSRNQLAQKAARRPALEAELSARLAVEDAAATARAQREAAKQNLRETARQCGVTGDSDELLLASLQQWLACRIEALEQHEKAVRDSAELENLLQGRSIQDLSYECERLEQLAQEAAREVNASELEPLKVDDRSADETLARLRRELADAERAASAKAGQLRERQTKLASVAEAEEELQAAQTELDRLHELDAVLNETAELLRQAQDKVHRDIAPVLAASVQRCLFEVTAGRYRDVTIDPQCLDIQVRDEAGRWRRAALLSHGTAEQVYLLLRAALAQHLAKRGESCPLLLDDVTVQSDSVRKQAILQVLRALSQERQIILFTQEPEVLAWAEGSLTEPDDRIILIDLSD